MDQQKKFGGSFSTDMRDDIIHYLVQQEAENVPQDTEEFLPKSNSAEINAKAILKDLLHSVECRIKLKDEFDARMRAHNQYPLFNLETIIPDFFIDDDLYEQLTFRETLVISTFDDTKNGLVPIAVGGLCLDIQMAKGSPPFQRRDVGLDQKVIEAMINEDLEPKKEVQIVQEPPIPDLKTIANSSVLKNDTEMIGTSIEQELSSCEDFKLETEPREFTKFLVHLSSQFSFDGKNGGSRITSWVDKNFHTLEEKRTEFVIDEGRVLNEKTLYTGLQLGSYFVRHNSTLEELDDRKFYSLAKARDYISEGADFLLMRYLAVSRYIGDFEMSCMYINGDMCRNIYNCTGPESGIINNKRLDLCKVYRTIIEECGITHRCITLLTLSGQIVKQDWELCDHVLHLNPLAAVTNEKPIGNERLLLRETWEHDMQLFSKFLDKKTICSSEIKSYLLDHPEFKDTIADYVQTILLLKPNEILDFTIDHFLHFAPQYLPRNEFFETDPGPRF